MKRLTFSLIGALLLASSLRAAPETVAVTYRFSPGNEAPLRAVIEAHRATLVRLKLVSDDYLLFRGHGFFLEIFTWNDEAIPDDPPAVVRQHWDEMMGLVDGSGGKPGLQVMAVERVRERAD